MKQLVTFLSLGVLLISCNNTEESSSEQVEGTVNVGKAYQKLVMDQHLLIDTLRNIYGSQLIDKHTISFDFRNYSYRYYKENGQRVRSRETTDEKGFNIIDFWYNDRFVRLINGDTVRLDKKEIENYKNSINSVFYFAYLPKALKDPAVNAKILDTVQLQGSSYYKMLVNFNEEGGGEDFEDLFLYWVHKDRLSLDYLAYQYYTEGGGMRFRAATNRRVINGITFQDYGNFEPTDADQEFLLLDNAFNEGRVKKVSEIELENIAVE